MPPISPPPPGRHQHMGQLRRVLFELARHGALAGQHVCVVVGVHLQGAGLGLAQA